MGLNVTNPGTLSCTKLCNYKLLLLPKLDGGNNSIIICLYLQVTSKLLFTSHDTIAFFLIPYAALLEMSNYQTFLCPIFEWPPYTCLVQTILDAC